MPHALAALGALLALACAPARATSLAGREFWCAWPRTPDGRTQDPAYDVDAELVVLAADRPVSVRVTAPGVDRTLSVAPGSPGTVRLPRAQVMITSEDVADPRAIHAVRTGTGCGLFSVLLRVPGSVPSVADDVTRVLPVDLLGTRYVPVSYWGLSELVVVATQDGTSVTVADGSCRAVGPVTLARGQALLHRCPEPAGEGSVTGALVTASAPVAVLSGSENSAVVSHEGDLPGQRLYWGWADVLLEAPWPVELLGREHAHGPFRRGSATASGDLVRIVSACDDTSVRVTEDAGTRSFGLPAAGDSVDVESPDFLERTWRLVPGPAMVRSDRAVAVGTFTVGQTNAGIGDPSLSILDPVERWERDLLVYMPAGYESSLTLVTEAAATGSVTLDGAPLTAAWQPVPGGAFAWTRLDGLAAGEHRVACAAPVFGEAMGATPGEAGAWSCPAIPLGRDPSGVVGSLRVEGADACGATCPGQCTVLRASPGFASYAWSTGAAGSASTECPDVTTHVRVTATDADGCRYEGSAMLVVVDAPGSAAIEGPDTACAGACITLAAPVGYDAYAWATGERTRTITACPSTDVTYEVTLTAPAGCGGTATHPVTVHGPPIAGDAIASHPDPCLRGLELTWLEAEWRPGSPGGAYNVYRREGGCVATDDPSWELVAVGLAAPPWRDTTTVVGRTYAYVVEAEDAPEAGACNPGPAHGGSTGRRCARPPTGLADPGDPDEARLIDVSPHLRGLSYERATPTGPAIAATFAWPTLPPIDPATHLEAWRGIDPRALVRVDPLVTGGTWRDARASDAWLLFYRIFDATSCGQLSDQGRD